MQSRLLALAALLAPLSVSANEGYIGLGMLNWNYDEDGFPEASASTFQLSIGGHANENVALEARFAGGGSDTVTVFVPNFGDVDIDLELDSLISLLMRPHTGGDDVRAYGLVGFSQLELTAQAEGAPAFNDDDSGLSYGAGFEIAAGESAWFHVEYVNYLRDDDYTFDGLTFGTRISF